MSKGTNQKLKLYYLAKIMQEYTDSEHEITMAEIKERLDVYGVTADRKSLYDDIEMLEVLGLTIEGNKKGRHYGYRVVSKQFELAELKLLVDAIQSSKFITEKKSRALIKKLMANASKYEAAQLNRQVVVSGRIKTMNESIYYNVDEIHNAINENRTIRFEYLKWDTSKQLVLKKEKEYEVSPWALTWDDENYYLIAYDSEDGKIKHYRVDKMRNIFMTDNPRFGKAEFSDFDMAIYAKRSFGMYGGKNTMVHIRFKDDLVGVFIDRFGKDIPIHKSEQKGYSETTVVVALSDQFYGWIFSLGTDVRIVGPNNIIVDYREKIRRQLGQYE